MLDPPEWYCFISCLERANERNKIIFLKDIRYTYIPHILTVL